MRDADGVGHRHDLVRPEADDAVGGDAAQLAVDLLQREFPTAARARSGGRSPRRRPSAAPPALPRVMKTSNGWPWSSSVIVHVERCRAASRSGGSLPRSRSRGASASGGAAGSRPRARGRCLPEPLDLGSGLGQLAPEVGDGRQLGASGPSPDIAARSDRLSALPLAVACCSTFFAVAPVESTCMSPAAVAVHGHALAVELVRQLVDLARRRPRSRRRRSCRSWRWPSRCTPGTPPASGCATPA